MQQALRKRLHARHGRRPYIHRRDKEIHRLARNTRGASLYPQKIRHKGDEIDYTQKIAVIGAGPSGMSCAYFLANMSYPVTVFDKDPIPGGMLTKGYSFLPP